MFNFHSQLLRAADPRDHDILKIHVFAVHGTLDQLRDCPPGKNGGVPGHGGRKNVALEQVKCKCTWTLLQESVSESLSYLIEFDGQKPFCFRVSHSLRGDLSAHHVSWWWLAAGRALELLKQLPHLDRVDHDVVIHFED